jgi:fucose 4-O-acetylase-like acetyltransferase
MAEKVQIETCRLGWIDRTKGIGIILVVLGHLPNNYAKFVYVFHMPLFFVLSGFLFNGNRRPSEFWNVKLRHLAIPYFGFMVLFNLKPCAALLLQMSHGLASVNWHFFKNYFTDQIWGGVKLTESQVVFWFPPVLLFTQLAYYHLIRSFSTPALKILICLSYAFALVNQWLYPGIQLPLAMNVVLGALPFFYFGTSLKQNLISVNLILLFCITFIFILALAIFSNWRLGIDMRIAYYCLPVISLMGALGGAITCFQLAKTIKDDSIFGKCLNLIGGGSMTIMYGHVFVMSLLAPMHLANLILAPVIITICLACHALLTRNSFTAAVFIGVPVQKNK